MRPVLDVAAVLGENRRLSSELVCAREEIVPLAKQVAVLQCELEQARAIPRRISTG